MKKASMLAWFQNLVRVKLGKLKITVVGGLLQQGVKSESLNDTAGIKKPCKEDLQGF